MTLQSEWKLSRTVSTEGFRTKSAYADEKRLASIGGRKRRRRPSSDEDGNGTDDDDGRDGELSSKSLDSARASKKAKASSTVSSEDPEMSRKERAAIAGRLQMIVEIPKRIRLRN